MNYFQTSTFVRLVVVFCLYMTGQLHAVISETISSNSISSPAFILDHHETDGDASTLRNGLKTDATVTITRSFFDPAISAEYRVIFQLLDSSGTALILKNGGIGGNKTIGASDSFPVNLSGIFGTIYNQDLSIYPDPLNTLDNKEFYSIVAGLQRRPNLLSPWTTIAGSNLQSSEEAVHHFTQTVSGDAEWNIRATVSDLKWERQYLLETDSNNDSFEVSIDSTFSRYDDWDTPISSETTTLIYDFDLIEQSTGTQVPLVDDGIVNFAWVANNYGTTLTEKIPSFNTVNFNANLRPTIQLKSGSESYILRCTVRHIEDSLATEYTDASCDLSDVGLLHFNGNLIFGSLLTNFDELLVTPSYGTTGLNYVNTVIRIANEKGVLPNAPNYVFGDGAALSVSLFDNGDAALTGGSQTVIDPLNPLDPIGLETNNLTTTYGPVTLTTLGASTTEIIINLPQGLVYLPDTTTASHHGQSKITVPGPILLASDLNISGNESITLSTTSAIVDESHPLVLYTDSVELTPSGELVFLNISNHEYIHHDALNELENLAGSGDIEPANAEGKNLVDRASNDRYWRTITNVSTGAIVMTATSDKSARMTTEFEVDAKPFETHFPANSTISWFNTGLVTINQGVILPGSGLFDVTQVDLPYHRTCPEDPCAKTVNKTVIDVVPSDTTLILSPTGGMYQSSFLNNPDILAWGARGDGGGGIDPNYPYAHRTDVFGEGNFFAPGYQLYASDNVLLNTAPYASDGGDNAPLALLLSGFNGDAGNPQIYQPTQAEYINGDGHYPGLNFIVQSTAESGASRLGGNTTDYPYDLLDNGASKYYTRCAGVFGRQVAVDGSFNPSLQIYGYDFELKSFQLSFIASDQEESWINGAVSVSGHSQFTQQFLGLNINCLGELLSAEMDPKDDSPKNLVYWNSTFIPKSLFFSSEQLTPPGACPVEFQSYLTMGVTTRVAHIDADLHGIFAFKASNGNLLTQTSGSGVGIDSELGIPANIAMDGPKKDYALVPTGKLRYSNPEENPAAVIGQPGGFVTFGATIDVPYFRDLQVQVMTSANDTPSAPLYLTPGWTEVGKTFFKNKDFDPNHKSWPEGLISLNEYQLPNENTNSTYLISAEQDLFGVIPLQYPLKWDDSIRTFSSMNPVNNDLFVINVNHQVDYLDADATKVSFGAKYEGLPEISLSNMLNDQIDQAAQSVSDAVTAPLKDAIDTAFSKFEDFLADSLDAVIDPVIDEAADTIICPLYDELRTQYNLARNAGNDWNTFQAQLDAELAARIYNTGFPTGVTLLRTQLEKLSDVTADAASVTSDLKNAIEKIIIGIDSIANQVELDGSNIPVFNDDLSMLTGTIRDGMLSKNMSGEREIVQNLVKLLLENLAEPEVAAVLSPLLSNLSSELNSELNSLLTEVDPTLTQITDALNQVRTFLVEVHVIVDTASNFIADFDQLVNEAITAVDGFQEIMAKPATRALTFLQDIAKQNGINITAGTDQLDEYLNIFEEFDKQAFVDSIKTELKDALLQSQLMQQFQYLVRQTLYDFQAKFEQVVASVLSQVTGVMKEMISQTIGALEDQINPLLGDVNSYMGAAEISGYAEFNGDSLRKLRLDAAMQFNIPDEMQLNVFLEVCAYTSEDKANACVGPGEKAVEVTIGATDVPFDWISDGLRASLFVKMSLKDKGSGLRPNGVGGGFELTGGTISLETFKITCLGATMAVGLDDCYIGAKACGEFNSYKISIGVFFGRTCSKDPLVLVDADVGEVLDITKPITGAYVYGEVWLPISELVLGIPASCLFNISAGVGTGVGFFIDDSLSPIFIGKMFCGVSGEALCVVSIKGEVTMVGIVQNGSFSASGTGKLTGKVGWCPFCIKFGASAKITYTNGDWDVDL